MTDACERILFAESDAEREITCQALFGKPFSECIDSLRREDFMRGIDDGRYMVLQAQLASGAGSSQNTVEVSFMSRKSDWRMYALYESEPAAVSQPSIAGWMIQEPSRFRITLPGEDAPRVFEKIRELLSPTYDATAPAIWKNANALKR